MSLIEQLGGYGAIKEKIRLINGPLGLINIGNSHYTKTMLESAMLEYRRQNNIYELGDLVVVREEYSKSSAIHKVDSLISGKKIVRHATPKEIEQGYRD